MSAERKCQAGCGHVSQHHVRGRLGDGRTLCQECRETGNESTAYHPFETIASLLAEVEARDEAVAKLEREYWELHARFTAEIERKSDIIRSVSLAAGHVGGSGALAATVAALRQIALTDEALDELTRTFGSHPAYSDGLMAAIRAARGVKEGG